MTTKNAIKHLSYKISYAKSIGEKWAYGIHIDALEIAVRAMTEERKQGKWIEDGYLSLPAVCSCCGEQGQRFWKFCSYCGADMREETDDAEIH